MAPQLVRCRSWRRPLAGWWGGIASRCPGAWARDEGPIRRGGAGPGRFAAELTGLSSPSSIVGCGGDVRETGCSLCPDGNGTFAGSPPVERYGGPLTSRCHYASCRPSPRPSPERLVKSRHPRRSPQDPRRSHDLVVSQVTWQRPDPRRGHPNPPRGEPDPHQPARLERERPWSGLEASSKNAKRFRGAVVTGPPGTAPT